MFQILKMYLKDTGNTSCPVSITLNKELLWLIYCSFLQIYWQVQANYVYAIFSPSLFNKVAFFYVCFSLIYLFWWSFYQYILVTFSISIKKVFSFRKSYCSYTKQGKNTGFGIREIQLHNFLSEFLNFYNCLLSESNRSYCQLDLLLMYCWDSLTFSKIQYSWLRQAISAPGCFGSLYPDFRII